MASVGVRHVHKVHYYLWFAPVLILLLSVTLYPTMTVMWMSFQSTRFFEMLGFAGLTNYTGLLASQSFWQFSANSLLYVFGTLAIVLPLGLLTALLVQALGIAGNVLRVVLLVPWTLSQAVVGSFWLWLLNPSYGPIAYVIGLAGLSPGLMLGDLTLALPLVILISAWWSFPYAMVVMSAALQGIPKELYEALELDGGGRINGLRYVVWPHVAPTLGSAGLMLAILYLSLITLIIVLTGGGPLGSTATWSFEIFKGTVHAIDIAPASALSVIVMLANLALGWAYLRVTGRVTA
jgi:multiple sugar transport system permease protein